MAYQADTLPEWTDMTKDQQELAYWCWSTGNLDFIVMPHQRQLWAMICAHVGLPTKFKLDPKYKKVIKNASSMKPLVIEVSRRFGKSSLNVLAMFALCMRNENHTYYYTAPNEGDGIDIINDVGPPLLRTCPPSLRPNKRKFSFTFQSGSRIKIGGTFNGAEGLRGRAANGVTVDEAGAIQQHSTVSCLTYVVSSILLPQLSTTSGWSILTTTPPANLQHDYYQFVASAQADNRFIRLTIMDNTAFDEKARNAIKEAQYATDPTGASWDREFMCIARADSNALIIPEDIQSKMIIKQYDRPEYFKHLHKYIVLDHGTVDLNAMLFAYYDYPNAKLVIEHEESISHGPSTQSIAKVIKQARHELWDDAKIYRAVCDSISQQIRIDLNNEFEDLIFTAPMKTILLSDNSGREGMVNQLINAINDGYIVIDPSCELLLETIKTATWKISSGKREFARLGKIGHCDMLAALVYMWRSCVRTDNPLVGLNFDLHHKLPINMPQKNDSVSVLGRAINRSAQPSLRNRFTRGSY